MTIKRFLILLLLIIPLVVFGQKKPINHSDYDNWESLSRASITDDGQWIKYEINKQEGDGCLYLYNVASKKTEKFERGSSADFSPGSEFFAFLVKPPFKETRMAKKEKKKADDMPKKSLFIKVLPDGAIDTVERVKSFKLFDESGSWIAYQMEKPEKKKKGMQLLEYRCI